jgi:5-methylcytosine-specific restriction endonuclease McrA
MARCTRSWGLEVHHKNRYGDNSLNNAEVLCSDCHKNTHSYGTPGYSPKPFSQAVKEEALRRAGYRCECTRVGCGFH